MKSKISKLLMNVVLFSAFLALPLTMPTEESLAKESLPLPENTNSNTLTGSSIIGRGKIRADLQYKVYACNNPAGCLASAPKNLAEMLANVQK